MWKNIVEPDRRQIKIWRMRIACWIPEATNTHSEHVILLFFHCSNGCTYAPQYYVIRTLSVFSFLYITTKKSTLLPAFTENFTVSVKSADSLNSKWGMSEGHLLKLTLLSSVTLVPRAAQSNTWVCGRSFPAIEDLNPARGCIVLGLQKHSLDGVVTNCCFHITADVKWL